MFTKIDKKILTILLIALFVVAVFGFFIYKNLKNQPDQFQNMENGNMMQNSEQSTGGSLLNGDQPQDNLPAIELEPSGIQLEGENSGSLTVCADKCGDGVCQETDNCNDNFNCTCLESKSACPQDCK